ncbi:hypothetical protein D3C87_1462720 [compost metagenome]
MGRIREWKVRTRSRASLKLSARPQSANNSISLLMKSLRDSLVKVTTVIELSSNPRYCVSNTMRNTSVVDLPAPAPAITDVDGVSLKIIFHCAVLG